MKNLNVTEAATIVGGTKKICTQSYEKITAGGVSSCQLITTCNDKHGNTTYRAKLADAANCSGSTAP